MRMAALRSVVLLGSSGSTALDDAALAAVRHWRAHRKCAGKRFAMPVAFTSRRRW